MNHESMLSDSNFSSLFSLWTKTSPSSRKKNGWKVLGTSGLWSYTVLVFSCAPRFWNVLSLTISWQVSSSFWRHSENAPFCELLLAWSHGYQRKAGLESWFPHCNIILSVFKAWEREREREIREKYGTGVFVGTERTPGIKDAFENYGILLLRPH